ncbi:murein biosynthesis integral membrane protein MurJ [bacterium]|nr:murein biosynthesis integral membrane protein MurJ [bacterium]
MEERDITTIKDETPGVLKAAWLIALVTIASKLIGFVRDMVVANFYGATLVSDAYFYALQIPSLAIIILGGVGGPFHSAAVAVFSKLVGNNGEIDDRINRLYNTFLTCSFIFFALCAVLGFFFADKIMGLIISAGSPELVSLATTHFKIMSPIILIGGIIGIYYGLLIVHKQYIIPNLSPMVLSLVVIGIISVVHNDKSGYALAVATTVGAVCQILIQFPKLRQIGYRIKPNLDIKNNEQFKNICELLFPAILSSTIGQISIYIDMFFASTLVEGAWTAVVFANRIFQFPVGILVTAFLVPLFPIFSRLAGEGNYDSIKSYFNKGVGVLFFAAIPMIIFITLLAQDGISIIFERGAFNSNAVVMVSEALCFLSFSILPYVFRDSITRVYYAFNDSKTPFIIAMTSIGLKALLNWLLIIKLNMGIAGITLSTSCITLFNAVFLGVFIYRKIRLDYKNLFLNFGKMILAGILTFIAGWFMCGYFDSLGGADMLFKAEKIISVIAACSVLYALLNIVFKMEYAKELLNRIRK